MAAASPSGIETFRSLSQWEAIELLLAVDQKEIGNTMRTLGGGRAQNVKIEEKLGAALDREKCDILVDFSNSSSALQHGVSALKRGVAPILNTSLSAPELRELVAEARMSDTPALVVPHLSILQVLALQFCNSAAKWVPDFEVVDFQPDHKLSTLSPFAKAGAEAMAQGWERRNLLATGGVDYGKTRTWEDVRHHTLKLKGVFAHQEFHFGGPGEYVSIKVQPSDSESIIDGLKLAIISVLNLKGVVVGLDKLLFPQPTK
jgi:4-hydroxy-tetrahydrodipicolinate reductase